MRKVHNLDQHICLAFAGLTADARILIDRARVECQSTRLTLDEPATVEGITRYIAGGLEPSSPSRTLFLSHFCAWAFLDLSPCQELCVLEGAQPSSASEDGHSRSLGPGWTQVCLRTPSISLSISGFGTCWC